jgi:hypothetical protein
MASAAALSIQTIKANINSIDLHSQDSRSRRGLNRPGILLFGHIHPEEFFQRFFFSVHDNSSISLHDEKNDISFHSTWGDLLTRIQADDLGFDSL